MLQHTQRTNASPILFFQIKKIKVTSLCQMQIILKRSLNLVYCKMHYYQ